MTDLRSTSHIEEELRADLTSIRRDWRRPDVDQGEVTRAMPGSTVLLTSAKMTRMAVQQDLRYWVHALMDDEIGPEPDGLDLSDVVGMCRHLLQGVREASGWAFVQRYASEVHEHALAMRRLTHREGVMLTDSCPVEVVVGDLRRPCGSVVRMDLEHPSDVRCAGCQTSDTIEGWQRRIVGELGPEPASALVPRLRHIGLRVTESTLRQWAARGVIPGPVGEDDRGRGLYDPRSTMEALLARERRKPGA